MGGTDRDTDDNLNTTTGTVDIFHWEIDTVAGAKAGGTLNATAGKNGDGKGNADDEYADTPWDRHDDNDAASENSYSASWGWSGTATNGSTDGEWIFEFSRKMSTGDKWDATFVLDEHIEMAIAFWTPNETTDLVWTDDGHYINYDNVIHLTLSDKKVNEDDSPGFGMIAALGSIFVLSVVIVRKRR